MHQITVFVQYSYEKFDNRLTSSLKINERAVRQENVKLGETVTLCGPVMSQRSGNINSPLNVILKGIFELVVTSDQEIIIIFMFPP